MFGRLYHETDSPWGEVAVAIRGGSGHLEIQPETEDAKAVKVELKRQQADSGKPAYVGEEEGQTFVAMESDDAEEVTVVMVDVGEVTVRRRTNWWRIGAGVAGFAALGAAVKWLLGRLF